MQRAVRTPVLCEWYHCYWNAECGWFCAFSASDMGWLDNATGTCAAFSGYIPTYRIFWFVTSPC